VQKRYSSNLAVVRYNLQETPTSTIYYPPLYYIPCVMKSSYTLGGSLTDPCDLSDFLVLVSSHDSQAAVHHLLEFRSGMSSFHGGRVAMAQVGLPNKEPFVKKKITVTHSVAVTHDLSIKSVSSPACSMRHGNFAYRS
jgi:hypothetical protein